MSTNNVQISTHDDFTDGASDLHLTAFFDPRKKYRENALAQIRAKSGHSPDFWNKLDLKAGVKGAEGSEELTADSPYQYQSGFNISDDVLDEQYVQSTIVDRLMQAGFSINSSLADYAYVTHLKSGRLEADIDMNPRARSRQDLRRAGLDAVAQPVVHVDYEFDERELTVRRSYGEDPEAEQAREARRAINRAEANMLFNGWGGNFNHGEFGNIGVDGLNSDDASRIIQTTSTNTTDGWSNPQVVLDDLNHLHDQVEGQTDVEDTNDVPLLSEVGGYLIVPRAQWGNVSRQDYESAATDEPLLDRIGRKYPYIEVLPAPRLNSDTAILVLNDRRYFGIVNAQSMTNTAWDIDGGHARRHKLISSRIPFVRRQPDGIRGLVRMTGI